MLGAEDKNSNEEEKNEVGGSKKSTLCMACNKEHGAFISLNQSNELQAHFMSEFDLAKAQQKDGKEPKSKDKLLKKRKRDGDEAGLEIGESELPKQIEPNKRQRIDVKSETYKSLFITSSTQQADMLVEGKYEGDFMTRCAKWGL